MNLLTNISKGRRLIKSRVFNNILKFLIGVALIAIIYNQLIVRENIYDLWTSFQTNLTKGHVGYLVLAILLMPINWILETCKWRKLTRRFTSLPFISSLKAVFTGITLSIFTPNRVGEYAGRILILDSKDNWKGIISTLVGSYSQLLILLSMGLIGLLTFIHHHIFIPNYILLGIYGTGILVIGGLLFVFYQVEFIIPFVKRIPYIHYLKKFVKDITILKEYNADELSGALTFAWLRYIVYSLQYLLILWFFGIEMSFIHGMAAIATIYLLQTSIPLPPILGLLARGEIAIVILSYYSGNEISILASTLSLWTLNLLIPSLIGMVFILNVNVLKSLGYDEKAN